MAKRFVTALELALIFQERLAQVCGYQISVSIVPVGDRWAVHVPMAARATWPDYAADIRRIERQLQRRYLLEKEFPSPRAEVVLRGKKEPAFKRGDRIQLTTLGRKRSPRLMSNTGTVVAELQGNVVRVVIDGRSDPITLHSTYVEKQLVVAALR